MRTVPGGAEASSPAFDPSDGLDEAELVAVALTLNPALRRARSELGETQALLVQAGAWPNPELDVAVRPELGGSATGAEIDLLFELLRPGERSARKAVAKAAADETRSRIVAEELAVVGEVRRIRLRLLANEAASRFLEQEAALGREVVALVQERRELGDVRVLDLHLAELQQAELERSARAARYDAESARRELNEALGLPPLHELPVTGAGEPLAIAVFEDIEDEELDARLLAGRPELAAGEAAYRRAEEELRLAVLRQYPSLRIGPSFERDVEGSEALGLGAALELPLFDRNQGEIAEKRAARERVRADYVARLHRLRAEAFDARERVRRVRSEVEIQEGRTLPLVERSEEAFEAAFRSRDVTVFEWLASRGQALRARREFLETLVRYGEAVVELETATGSRSR